ncbi:hypothetical protein [Fusibacter ferrireducens]|uniref:Uncharacterized protein n=1 Tax=Fusibacter ferrireducens TaxID=2785058 RepID=A0ABR9ZUR9_9FIRM|nr:hypothetical protein [Fusibacter ferrireducens]MBF4693630.1 hypothetical protein [Fusibacter ferrireducens]
MKKLNLKRALERAKPAHLPKRCFYRSCMARDNDSMIAETVQAQIIDNATFREVRR